MPCINICNTTTNRTIVSILHPKNTSLCKLASGIHSEIAYYQYIPFHISTLYFYLPIDRSNLYLPSKQLCPVRSFGQVHMYDPRVLRQVPLYMQGFRRHSSTSNMITCNLCIHLSIFYASFL